MFKTLIYRNSPQPVFEFALFTIVGLDTEKNTRIHFLDDIGMIAVILNISSDYGINVSDALLISFLKSSIITLTYLFYELVAYHVKVFNTKGSGT